mgnify:CR=1 FL=1|jgi:hypothetical protein
MKQAEMEVIYQGMIGVLSALDDIVQVLDVVSSGLQIDSQYKGISIVSLQIRILSGVEKEVQELISRVEGLIPENDIETKEVSKLKSIDTEIQM